MLEKDKLLHFIVCENLLMVFAIVFRFIGLGNWAYLIAFVLAFGAGIWKESRDKRKTGLFDRMDIVFDFLGAFAGIVLVSLAGVC